MPFNTYILLGLLVFLQVSYSVAAPPIPGMDQARSQLDNVAGKAKGVFGQFTGKAEEAFGEFTGRAKSVFEGTAGQAEKRK